MMKIQLCCGIFVDLQKVFDTVDHQTLLAKLNHYGICRVSNDWFKSSLSNRNQYVSIYGYESGLSALNCGIPQGPVLGLLVIADLKHLVNWLKIVSTAFLLVCFLCLKKSTCETRKNVFYFTLKALFILEIIKF